MGPSNITRKFDKCLDCQIYAWNRYTGKAWNEFEGKVWPCEHTLTYMLDLKWTLKGVIRYNQQRDIHNMSKLV